MTKPPTAVQRRIIEAADPATGRLSGSEAQLAALVRQHLAFRHPRPPHAYFLTPAGHRVREEAARAPAAGAPAPPPATPAGSGLFAARTGAEPVPPPGGGSPARARDVRSAWEGLLEMRRMTNSDGARDRPCGWERTHLVQAAALALEAAGCPPGPGGYRVGDTPQPEAVAVRDVSPDGLRTCARALEAAGWQVSEHAERPQGARYLLASPRRG
ncbi:hypothetical protein GCM10010277_23120 [Streptomyces longisporoflavus]|uniref:hypothetical protein n=1 Tax=Streptomyces longisporoflavus TaxID=28044 RepID=UPI00167D0AFB|nr:hypothetical protein [Streptomyces longisporoflavus]GGV36567.1 hypothetical protein GCM10010277_23120 [Streptomyces longisporoflavus]